MKSKYGQVTIQLEPDEACVVLEKKFWDHMIQWQTMFANESNDPTEKANWSSIITAIESWMERTYQDPRKATVETEDYDDEW